MRFRILINYPKWKLFKWFLPVISYILLMGFLFFIIQVERMIYGQQPNPGPTVLPGIFIVVVYLPVILWGYLLLPVTQFLYKKGDSQAKIFAFLIILLSIGLVVVLEWKHIANWWYFISIILSQIVVYYLVFFLSLFGILKKEKTLSNLFSVSA